MAEDGALEGEVNREGQREAPESVIPFSHDMEKKPCRVRWASGQPEDSGSGKKPSHLDSMAVGVDRGKVLPGQWLLS